MKRLNILPVFSILVSIVIFLIVVKPLFHPGLFPTIDNISVVRLEAMAQELSNRQFPVRYVHDLGRGHGYALFGYYAPLPFYTGAVLHLFGTNLVGALKRSYLLAITVGSIGIFGLSYELFGPIAAAGSVVAYMLSPFLGYDVYWRGGIGEVWAMGFVPWALWFLFRVIRTSHRRDILVAALSIAGLMVSHNLTAYMGMCFVALWTLLWMLNYKRGLVAALASGVLGLGMSAFFWLPAFITRASVWVSYLQADRSSVFDGLLHGSLREIFVPTFIPMIINWTAIILPCIAWWFLSRKNVSKHIVTAANIIGVLFAGALFFMTGLSKPVWDVFFPVLYIFQFPWRFLTMVTIFGSLLTGGLIYMSMRRRFIILVGICMVLVYSNIANFRPLSYEFVDKYRPQDPCGTSWGFEYLPVFVKTCLKTPWEKPYRIMSGDVDVITVTQDPKLIMLHVVARTKSILQVGQYAYPGWTAFVDGNSVSISHDNENGLIEFEIPEGEHRVSVMLKRTSIEQWGNGISVVSLVFVAGGFIQELYVVSKRKIHIKKV